MIDTSVVSLLPYRVDTVTYLLDVTGGMVIFAVLWWTLCFAVRNGIDGSKAVAWAIRERKPLQLGRILTGGWKPLGETEPIRPAQPQLEDLWISL